MKTDDATAVEERSLDRLVDDHYEYLCRYAHRYFRDSDQIEDIVQDVFLAATESIDRFEERCAPRTWLVGILRHKIMDRLRAARRDEPIAQDPSLLDSLFDNAEHWKPETGPLLWGASPEEVFKQKEFFACLERCLQRLPEKVRQIFCLREVEGYERDHICEQFGLSSSNAGVLLHRARLSIQQCLQTNWFQGSRGRP